MDFTNRGVRQPGETPTVTGATPTPPKKGSRLKKPSKLLSIVYIVLLFSATILVIAVLASMIFSKKADESKYVDKSKMQAVFLNNGQVYFGNIDTLNPEYLKLSNIYYLRVNQQVQPGQQANQNDVSLAKLGCELHGPQDQMLINRKEITFWENLKGDGQVAKAVTEFVKANPNGQTCQPATGGSGTGSTGTGATTGTGTAPATTGTTKTTP